jgi:hypothetical protein
MSPSVQATGIGEQLSFKKNLKIIGAMSNWIRQGSPLHQVQCRAQIDSLFYSFEDLHPAVFTFQWFYLTNTIDYTT